MVAPARFLYSGIRVQNLVRSLAFYRMMGFKVESRGTMGHGGEWVHLQFPRSRHLLELNYYPQGNRFYEPPKEGTEFDHFGFYTSDITGWLRRGLRAARRSPPTSPTETSRLIYLADPERGVQLDSSATASPPRRRRRA